MKGHRFWEFLRKKIVQLKSHNNDAIESVEGGIANPLVVILCIAHHRRIRMRIRRLIRDRLPSVPSESSYTEGRGEVHRVSRRPFVRSSWWRWVMGRMMTPRIRQQTSWITTDRFRQTSPRHRSCCRRRRRRRSTDNHAL